MCDLSIWEKIVCVVKNEQEWHADTLSGVALSQYYHDCIVRVVVTQTVSSFLYYEYVTLDHKPVISVNFF